MMTVAVARSDPASSRTGETESFEALYRRLWPSMVRLAHLLTGSESLGEEVAQDAFIGLRGAWDRVANPSGYVRTAVVNRSRTVGRREARERLPAVARTLVSHEQEVDETWHQLRQLPARQRAALVLRFYEDLPEAEIARLLGCRPGTVKSNIHRGLARLRESLK